MQIIAIIASAFLFAATSVSANRRCPPAGGALDCSRGSAQVKV